MKVDNVGKPARPAGGAGHRSDSLASSLSSLGIWPALKKRAGLLLPFGSILALVAGVLLGTASQGLSSVVNTSAETFIDWYGYGAPFLIFLVLAPVLSRIFSTRRRGKFGFYVLGWLSGAKVLSLVWAVLFTVAVFGLPLLPQGSISVGGALVQTSRSLLSTLTDSTFFWAIYAAVVTGLLAVRFKPLAGLLERGVTAIEYAGQYIQPAIPLFMFAVGVYIQSIPRQLEDELGLGSSLNAFARLDFLGIHIDPNTTTGMVTAYVAGSLLVAVACFIWHFAILALAKRTSRRFSVVDYFKNYWAKAYPLLWSTSSESLATPLNLYILSKHAPWVRPTVRRVVVGAGSVLCSNGTLICAVILLGVVGGMLGLRFSLLELLLCIPVAFLISFGVPGIPGELLLFAGPLSLVLGVPSETLPLFLTLYLGLQIGLPDSFRTGNNTTNNYLYAIILNETYIKRFMPVQADAPAEPAGRRP
jgi:Na+/H+-dicarboxylate symporter